MLRVLLAGLAGGLVYFVWGAISWMVLPWHNETLRDLPGEATILRVLRQNVGESGVYWFPGLQHAYDNKAATDTYQAQHRAGPVGWLVYNAEGREPMPMSTYVKGYIIDFLAAFIVAGLLAASGPSSFRRRVMRVTLLGMFAALATHAAQWNWMLVPGGYTASMMMDLVFGWLLAGLVIAGIAGKPAVATAHAGGATT